MSYGGPCAFCSEPVDSENAAYRVTGIEFTRDQGGANVIRDRERVPGWIAHKSCVDDYLFKKNNGIASGQGNLLEAKEDTHMPNNEVVTALAVRDETSAVMLTNQQLTMIANTSFVPAAFRGKVPEVLACVATGRALGLPDMTSLRGINVIEGKATLSAELMTAIVRSHGHSITGSSDDKRALVRGKRVDNGDTMEATFTIEMAERAGLLAKKGIAWKAYPEAMLWARAVSQLCRMLFADCFAGATYVPEEMEETADETLDELPEPDAEPSGDDGSSEPPDEPSPAPDAPSSGSVSPWMLLIQVAESEGFLAEHVRETAKAHFAGILPRDLTSENCTLILKELRAEAAK